MKTLITAAATLLTLCLSSTAQAFCGFYVARALKNGYLRQVQAPVGVSPELIAWMELS